MMPPISATEKAALESGGLSFEQRIFEGTANLQELKKYNPQLTTEEQSFLDNECEQLCMMLDDYKIIDNKDMPHEVWEFLRRRGFFCLKLHKEWGGKGFSSHAVSRVLQKVQSRSPSAGVTVAVPNSLGPGELLMCYGTPAQKENFLPRLCSGELIPCFALTAPHSGSDAASMKESDGYVVEENGVLGVRVSFKKRYITLAPVAGIVGLAFNLHDPKGLLKGVGGEGITIALLERNHPGLKIGRRHDVGGNAFMNGTVEGTDVFIPMDCMLGGQSQTGKGWNFLMEQLSEGRGISLPAGACSAASAAAVAAGAYSRIRQQFRVPIGDMGGVQEHLGRIAGQALVCKAGSDLVAAMVDNHESPSVLSAVLKQQATDRARMAFQDASDVLAGSAICRGPSSALQSGYFMIPVGITVEGANTLTRTLMIFGQGVMRSHPHLLNIVQTLEKGNDVSGFTKHVLLMVKHALSNVAASLVRAVGRPRSTADKVQYYERNLNRLAANFAATSDMALILGGNLKREEMISGRMADALSAIFLGYATLWYCERRPNVQGLDTLMDYALTGLLHEAQEALDGVARNFPLKPIGLAMRLVQAKALGAYPRPTDKQTAAASDLITNPTDVWRMFAADLFFHPDKNDQLTMLRDWLPEVIAADRLERQLKKEKRSPTVEEQALLARVEAARDRIVQVDTHAGLGIELTDPNYVRPALRPYPAVKVILGAQSSAQDAQGARP